jgi:hypothetical protein
MYDADIIFENADLKKLMPTCIAYEGDNKKHKLYKLLCVLKLKRACKNLNGEYIFIQYPTNLGNVKLFPHFIKNIARKNKVVFIINNLNGLKHQSAKLSKVDKEVLRRGFRIISQNKLMSEYLHQECRIPLNRLMSLDFLYYLTNSINVDSREKTNGIVYAGNLNESDAFINKYIENKIETKLHIYGESEKKELLDSDNTKYCGEFPTDIVNLKLKGSFGLVWGGSSIDSSEGKSGEYGKFNSPHKASLYIIARLPIITSKDSAISYLVKKYNIGFAIESLREIPSKIEELSDEQYQKMVSNITLIANRISTGKNLMDIIEEIVN